MESGQGQRALGPEQRRAKLTRQQEAVVSVFRAAEFLRRSSSALFERHGITSQQYNVLRILRGAGREGLPTLEIAARMIESTPGITRLLDRLESKRLVTRQRSEIDRRLLYCYVTKTGLDMLSELDGPMKAKSGQLLSVYKDQEVETLISLLTRLQKA